ncbi:response regulator [Planctomyces sp. SH-PL14]|uniref:response regulator n=1 Tax=Planctomyces sp. SH-PL14 TaxID=1632864 RepID=UPI00078ED999|nr:response regulator [Planctomyces sp. SH-PL14]AMV20837.1 Autoinducer 2 sensor kinase/phosphatase LuxQ [Planctomyces sp. SH-PL14]
MTTSGSADLRDDRTDLLGPGGGSDPPVRILLVDDDPKNLIVLESILEDPRYRLVKADSADAALLALVQGDFALIILDIQMPGMNGLELAQMIKQRKKTATIPIIFLTAYFSDDQHVLEGYGTGAIDYLHKPVNAAILRSKVAAFADLHRKTLDLAQANTQLQAEIDARRLVQDELSALNERLESRVAERTAELETALRSLRESDDRLRLAQDAGEVGIWALDLAEWTVTWTDVARSIFHPGRYGDTVRFDEWMACVHEDDRHRIAEGLGRPSTTAGDGLAYRQEYRVRHPDGVVLWVEAVGAFEVGPVGRPIRVQGCVRDISERKQMELELKEQDRRKDEFLAMLGHELRNPLAPIRNSLSLMQFLAEENEEIRTCHDVVDRQVSQLTRIVDDLLDVSRVSRGKIRLERTTVDLAEVIRYALETCRQQMDARRHAVELSWPAGPLHVAGDMARLSQAVFNLLNNAAKYTEPGGEIAVALGLDPDDSGTALVSIRDNGRGFDSNIAADLFSLFYQADRTIDRADGGLGIGLALVKSIVEMHGGTVWAVSAGRGQGSEFTVRLPRLRETLPGGEPAESASAASRENPESTSPSAVGPERGRQILVVDDNHDAATTLARLLRQMGHRVRTAHDGEAALASVREEAAEIVLLDIGLPRRDGYDVCREIRRTPGPQPRIVALTGYGREEDRARTKEAGFDGHLTKPVRMVDLERLLTSVDG